VEKVRVFSLHGSGFICSAMAADGMQRALYPLGCFKASSDVALGRDLSPPRGWLWSVLGEEMPLPW